MLVAKQVADLITLSRAMLPLVYIWVGLTKGAAGLPLAAMLLVYSWTSDILDDPVARRSRKFYHSWLGDHDLEVDMAASIGVLLYLLLSGYASPLFCAVYALFWVLVFWLWGIQRSAGMLFQAPLYGWLIWISLHDAFEFGVILVFWILCAVIVTWPRFPREVVPGFLSGFGFLKKRNSGSE